MTLISLRLLALISALAAIAVSGRAATNPRYGGTLRVELNVASVSLDPRQWQVGSLDTATDAKLAALVFERLAALDNYGRFQPALAADWSHDALSRRWQFTIRGGVKFSDGAPLTATDVVSALQPLLPERLQLSAPTGTTIVIQSTAPEPDLLEQLASGRCFVYRVLPSGELVGTGPFVLGEAPSGANNGEQNSSGAGSTAGKSTAAVRSGAHLYFRANEEAWSGRPFLDAVDVTLGVPALRALFDLQLGKADLIELSPELVPRAKQANLRVWSSEPVTLYGLRFDATQTTVSDPRLREALSLALDRGTMASVLLQKQAAPAAALLPQWLSGYAFLFNVETNLERAKELRRSLLATGATGAAPLRLRVDPAGDLAKLLGERVAVNARQASIAVQVVGRTLLRGGGASPPATPEPVAGAHLFAWRYSSLSAKAELDTMFAAYNLTEPPETNTGSTEREQLYARERRVLEEWRVLPLVEQAESVGIGASVRDWMPARWGEWHLADVWLESSEPGQPVSANFGDAEMRSSRQMRTSASGATP